MQPEKRPLRHQPYLAECLTLMAFKKFYPCRCSALDLASKGIRVNAVNPGLIKTEIFQKGGITGDLHDHMMEEEIKRHPIGRLGTVEDVAALIEFLASSQATFITGNTVGIDGGRALMT